MAEVRVELVKGDKVVRLGEVTPDTPPGSMSSQEPEKRRVFIFGFMDGEAGVWESEVGLDVETPETRQVFSAGLTRLSDLSEPYEQDFYRNGTNVGTIRFTAI